MATRPNIHAVQDLPPAGGYPKINYVKGIRPRGPPGWAIWGGVIGFTVWGFVKLSYSNEKHRFATKQKREARMAILPFLLAEKDREFAACVNKQLAHEAEVMKGTEWTVGESVYSQRWSRPTL